MYNEAIKYLSWDSDFFNKKIGKVDINNSLNAGTRLIASLQTAKAENYNLIYVFCEKDFFIDQTILKEYNGKLVDKKILYSRSLFRHCGLNPQSPKNKGNSCFCGNNVALKTATELTPELENLAYTSGSFSRFKLDENFAQNDFRRMYKTWLENSLNKKIADFVFVAEENEQIKGMVTLNIAGEIGHIGLIAVLPETQGKGFGKTLIQKCENELLARKIFTLEVPTQMDNKNACIFYEKCDFKIKGITNIYHFWL